MGGLSGGFKYLRATKYLKANGYSKSQIKEVMKSFKGTPTLKTSKGVKGFRYYDNINAFKSGRYITSKMTNNPIVDLVLYNNQATNCATVYIKNGVKYLSGHIAGSPVNAVQYFIANASWAIFT